MYDYFTKSCSTVPVKDFNSFAGKYKAMSIKNLKSALQRLKLILELERNVKEIKYISGLIRTKLKKKIQSKIELSQDTILEEELRAKFWPTARRIFKKASNFMPTFNIDVGYNFFVNTLKKINFNKFVIPSWIPKLQSHHLN